MTVDKSYYNLQTKLASIVVLPFRSHELKVSSSMWIISTLSTGTALCIIRVLTNGIIGSTKITDTATNTTL